MTIYSGMDSRQIGGVELHCLGPLLQGCMTASRAALLHGIRSLAEAASLPQTRALLERARNGILGADTASQALPFLEARHLLLSLLPLL